VILLPAPNAGLVAGASFVFASAALIGFTGGVWDIGVFTLRQRRTDPRLMGRAFAISMALNSVGFPIGAALGGWLATQSIEVAVWVAVVFGVLGVVLAWWQLPRSEPANVALEVP
jgi:MFS family permease